MVDLDHLQQVRNKAEQLFDMAAVDAAIDNVAEQITQTLAGSNPVVITVMNGGLVFAGKLLPKLDFLLEQDYLQVSRYGNATQGGDLQWLAEPKQDLTNRTVLIVDDILDQGITLQAVTNYCLEAEAKTVMSAVLVEKLRQEKACCSADFVALQTSDVFLFGCGLDYQSYWRNAPGIFALKGEDVS